MIPSPPPHDPTITTAPPERPGELPPADGREAPDPIGDLLDGSGVHDLAAAVNRPTHCPGGRESQEGQSRDQARSHDS
ncbi:MAG: hypothetical protein LBR11_11845 [Deltaproteobacteria bacterium]|nr:hypothetical protein [Deltaproteobacteria bacterium]